MLFWLSKFEPTVLYVAPIFWETIAYFNKESRGEVMETSNNLIGKCKSYCSKGSDTLTFEESEKRVIHKGILISMAETSLKCGMIDVSRYNQVVKAIERKYG